VVRCGDGRRVEPRVAEPVFEERLDAQQQDTPPGIGVNAMGIPPARISFPLALAAP
jgi:hypothetical protein